MSPSASGHGGRRGPSVAGRLFAAAAALTLFAGLFPATAAENPDRLVQDSDPLAQDGRRDWSDVQLAWRGDPRPAADTPGGVEAPMSRRAARRARRAAERGWGERARRHGQPSIHPTPDPTPDLELEAARPIADDASARMVCHRDVPYVAEGHPRQRLDLFLPEGHHDRPIPTVIWIHGDTWRDGSKNDCPIAWLVGEGYAVASIGYRLTDTAVFPAQIDDCRQAVSFLKGHARDWKLDPERFAAVGTAAGGHLAALVGLADDTGNDRRDSRVAAVCVVAAPTLLTALGPTHDRPTSNASLLVGGPLPEFREAAQRASPLTHVSREAPPFLIIHAGGGRAAGPGDPVPLSQSRQFDAALREVGATSTLAILDEPKERLLRSERSAGGGLLLDFLSTSIGGAGVALPAKAVPSKD